MQVRFEKGGIIYHAAYASLVPSARGKFIVHKINSQIVDFLEVSFFLFASN